MRDLVARARDGDVLAVNDLLDLVMPSVERISAAIAGPHADDATQEALVAVFKGLPGLREPDALWGWVKRITVRESVRVASRARARQGTSLDEAGADTAPAPGDATTEVDVAELVAALPDGQRAAVVLRTFGLDEAEIAEALGVAEGTVKSRLHRARATLREWMR